MIHLGKMTRQLPDRGTTLPFMSANILPYLLGQNETLTYALSMPRTTTAYDYGCCCTLSNTTGATTINHYDAGNSSIDTGKNSATYNYDNLTQTTIYADSNLYYYGYRYYCPELGRWVSKDPIGEVGGPNRYQFVKNSPAQLIDPFGLRSIIASITEEHGTSIWRHKWRCTCNDTITWDRDTVYELQDIEPHARANWGDDLDRGMSATCKYSDNVSMFGACDYIGIDDLSPEPGPSQSPWLSDDALHELGQFISRTSFSSIGLGAYTGFGASISLSDMYCCRGQIKYRYTIVTICTGIGGSLSLNPVPVPSLCNPSSTETVQCPPDTRSYFMFQGSGHLGGGGGASIEQGFDDFLWEGEYSESGFEVAPDLDVGINYSYCSDTVLYREKIGCCYQAW